MKDVQLSNSTSELQTTFKALLLEQIYRPENILSIDYLV